jgi:hypothetical protein
MNTTTRVIQSESYLNLNPCKSRSPNNTIPTKIHRDSDEQARSEDEQHHSGHRERAEGKKTKGKEQKTKNRNEESLLQRRRRRGETRAV